MEDNNLSFFNKDAWKAVVGAVILLVIGQAILLWQYNRLEGHRLVEIEEQLAKQQQAIEKGEAQDVLEKFLAARVAQDETKASRYVTERAMQQKVDGDFVLIAEYEDYEIVNTQKLKEDVFQYQVEMTVQDGLPPQIEIIKVIKILESYYIDSVTLAG
ncbi:hypothetical protein IID24_00370 [Patescibacteria group bacterium]|nr:hypothetical protein [Patescibacteria group bacterium]